MMEPDRLKAYQKRTIANWDEEELEHWLQLTVSEISRQTSLCFFVDGLDECIETDLERVVDMIKMLMGYTNVKFCISSRDETSVNVQLYGLDVQSLNLHELTRRDICRFVTNELRRCFTAAPLSEDENQSLTTQLVANSQGVFLWAVLVAQKLRMSINRGDTSDQLHHQLTQIPRSMKQLYEQILEKSGATEESRQPEAASYFKFLICHSDRGFYHDGNTYCGGLTIKRFVPLYRRFHGSLRTLEHLARRLGTLCAGFVTIDSEDRGSISFTEVPYPNWRFIPFFVDAFLMNGHEDCRLGPNTGRKVELSDIGKYMVRWCESMHESSSDDKVKFLQHLDRSLSHYFTSTFGIPERNWVFVHMQESCRSEKAKFLLHDASTTDLARANYSRDYGGETWGFRPPLNFETDDSTLDFASFAFKWGFDELLSHYLEYGFSLTASYKDYLLLCSLRPKNAKPPRVWIEKLLKDGANPNAMFYWGLHDRVKTSPWLEYLVDTLSLWINVEELRSNFDPDTVKLFLDQGARLDDRTILIYAVKRSRHSCDLAPLPMRFIPPRPGFKITRKLYAVLVIEVNAKFLLEKQLQLGEDDCRNEKIQSLFSRGDVQEVQPHRQILLIHSRFEKQSDSIGSLPVLSALEDLTVGSYWVEHEVIEQFAEASPEDSERIFNNLDGGNDLFPYLEEHALDDVRSDNDSDSGLENLSLILQVWEASHKIPSIRRYLEERGYYKPPDDPAVIQSPIPMFEDNTTSDSKDFAATN
ncbi:hypothetical protein NPX13_g7312 [Xylaria arbuscula]|uniref:NACHT domain-containing protein n=1 Tax=Xylaria arbuscula TaxID=114810 RepID=A0A9W8NAS6_9PEZI|nr:hypothetical protein NPX13_g7312 [Xylaria arbuscula]